MVRKNNETPKKIETSKKTERLISAGGVIYRTTSVGVEVALIEVESKSGLRWSLPKGQQEQGERLARTAHREVKEETGLDGRILQKLDDIHYFYSQKTDVGTRRFFKIVYFFLMEYTFGSTELHDKEVVDCRWFPIDVAIGIVRFEDEKNVLLHAKDIILSYED